MKKQILLNEISNEEKLKVFKKMINLELKKNPKGTDGEGTLNKYLQKKPKIKNILDDGEEMKYVFSKKSEGEDLMSIIIIFVSINFFYDIFIHYFNWRITIAFIAITYYLLQELRKVYITDKSIIFINRKHKLVKLRLIDLSKIMITDNIIFFYKKKGKNAITNEGFAIFFKTYIEELEESSEKLEEEND